MNYRDKYDKIVFAKKNESNDAPRISEEHFEEIRNAFELFDSDSSGLIRPSDMVNTFEKLNLHKEKPSIYKLLQSMNTNENNSEGLTFDQFMNLTMTYYSDRYTREGIRHIFELFDEDNLGCITRDSFNKMAMQLGDFLNKDQLDEIFDKASRDGRVIAYEDFEYFMKKDETRGR